jgi:hypothetical protein
MRHSDGLIAALFITLTLWSTAAWILKVKTVTDTQQNIESFLEGRTK